MPNRKKGIDHGFIGLARLGKETLPEGFFLRIGFSMSKLREQRLGKGRYAVCVVGVRAINSGIPSQLVRRPQMANLFSIEFGRGFSSNQPVIKAQICRGNRNRMERAMALQGDAVLYLKGKMSVTR